MFKDLQKGYTVSVLDKSGSVITYKTGTVVDVSQPRYENRSQLPGQVPQFSAERVLDLTVEIDGTTNTYVVNEHSSIASTPQITLACDTSLIANEVRAKQKYHKDEMAKFSSHEENAAACESILETIDKSYAESKEQNERITKIESTLADLTDGMADVRKLLTVLSKSKKE